MKPRMLTPIILWLRPCPHKKSCKDHAAKFQYCYVLFFYAASFNPHGYHCQQNSLLNFNPITTGSYQWQACEIGKRKQAPSNSKSGTKQKYKDSIWSCIRREIHIEFCRHGQMLFFKFIRSFSIGLFMYFHIEVTIVSAFLLSSFSLTTLAFWCPTKFFQETLDGLSWCSFVNLKCLHVISETCMIDKWKSVLVYKSGPALNAEKEIFSIHI